MQRQRLNRDGVKSQGAYMEPAADGNWVAYADAAELERRLALALAEVQKWRSGRDPDGPTFERFFYTQAWSCDDGHAVRAAMAATDADPVLKAMIEKGSA